MPAIHHLPLPLSARGPDLSAKRLGFGSGVSLAIGTGHNSTGEWLEINEWGAFGWSKATRGHKYAIQKFVV